MKFIKSLGDILNNYQDKEEVYTTDQKYKYKRKMKGYFTRSDDTFSFIHLIKAWEEIVGKMLASNSIPLKIKSKTLYIMTKHQIFAQELGFLNQTILEKIEDRFPEIAGKINKIKYINNEFTLQDFNHPNNPTEEKKSKPKLHPYSPEYKRRVHHANELFQDIEDEVIKQALINYYLNS